MDGWREQLAAISGGALGDVPFQTALIFILLLALSLVALRDLRLRRDHRQALQHKDEELANYRRAVDAHAMVNISGANGHITYVNDTLARATGHAPADLVGKLFRDSLLADPQGSPGLLAQLRSGRIWAGEAKLRCRNGDTLWTRSTIVPFLDAQGTLVRTMALRTDITEAKLLQAKLQERAMIDRLRDEVYVFATDTLELLYLNKRSKESMEKDGAATTGRRHYNVGDPFDEAAFRDRVAPLLSGEAESVLYESTWRGGPVEINLQLEHSLEGKPRFVAVVRDISKRKRAENDKAEFVATVSHELRSPLTSIKGSLNLIGSGIVGEVTPKAKGLVDVALRNVDRLLRLINDLLDLEKLDANMMDLGLQPVNLVALAEEAVAAHVGYGHEFGVKLRYVGTREPVIAHVNRDGMMQVLTNLLSNAVKFSPAGQWVDLSVSESAAGLRMTVTDRGPGIPPEAHQRMFSRFAQAHADVDRGLVGTGLGLSIAQSIAEKHAGRIWFTSESGVGTTFHVDLPRPLGLQAVA